MTPEREAEIREYLAGIRYRPIKSEDMALELLSALQAERERADAADQALDRVWSALGITTVPVGMTAAAEVAKLKERADAAEKSRDRVMEDIDQLSGTDEALNAAISRIAALEAALKVNGT